MLCCLSCYFAPILGLMLLLMGNPCADCLANEKGVPKEEVKSW